MGPFVHRIDPVIWDIGGLYLWWYGLSYSLGFIGVFFWLKRNRYRLSLSLPEVYTLTLLICAGVLLGGRLVEVFFYEWSYYSSHLAHIPAVWLGGMSTHGILLGSICGIVYFCKRRQRRFLEVTDVLAIAAAYIMGVGRIGNFIDGQIPGSVTDVWWAVKFPDVDGFRHPVVLYDGIKNLLLIPFLLLIRRGQPPRGVLTAHFILWYGFLRIFVDLFREYRTDLMGFAPGQEFNILMTVVGGGMLLWIKLKGMKTSANEPASSAGLPVPGSKNLLVKRIFLVLLILIPIVIPSDWTQDVPERYGHRHPGIEHSLLYPEME